MSCRRWKGSGGRKTFAAFDYNRKDFFNWISVIRLPDFITRKDFVWAVEEASRKKKLDCSSAEFLTINEGLCVQAMHIGPFNDEPATIAVMDQYLKESGYMNDITDDRMHHEIYLSDARKVERQNGKQSFDIRSKEANNYRPFAKLKEISHWLNSNLPSAGPFVLRFNAR